MPQVFLEHGPDGLPLVPLFAHDPRKGVFGDPEEGVFRRQTL